jgi:glycosyltransferase involved in cell wall biosynthesis
MNSSLINSVQQAETGTARRPRVLMVVGLMWGCNGITTHLYTLTKGLLEQGWDVALALDRDPTNQATLRALDRFAALNVPYFLVPFASARKLSKAASIIKSLDAAIRQYQPDVIHTHSLSLSPYIQFLRLFHKIPVVSICHLQPTEPQQLQFKRLTPIVKLNPAFFGDRLIAISSEIRQIFIDKLGIEPNRIHHIYYGIDTEHFRPPSPLEALAARQQFDLTPEAQVICLVGRLNPIKGHDLLFAAMKQLKAAGIEVIALCAGMGYGDEEQTLRSQAQAAGILDQVKFLGFTETRSVIWASDLLVLPSLREGASIVIPEAMLCGVVPVQTPTSGATDHIRDGIDGFIVPFNDATALATRLQQLLQDHSLKTQMAATALNIAQQKFTAERMLIDTIALYREIMPSPPVVSRPVTQSTSYS